MPIYEYACQKCNHSFDALQKMNADPLTECPECGEPALKKLLSAPNFRLKGSGWYETDFKTSGKKNLASGSEDSAPTASGDKSSDKPGGDSAKKDSSESKKTA